MAPEVLFNDSQSAGQAPQRKSYLPRNLFFLPVFHSAVMTKKLAQFQTLTGKREKVNPKLTALNVELARVKDEIEKLLNTLTGASAVLISYANTKILWIPAL